MTVDYADFSGPPPGAKALKDAGFSGVIRYIGLGSDWKQIHRTEYLDYINNGVDVLLVAELNTTDAWQAADDYAYGVRNAQIALADARAEGIPDYEPIFWAADAHATPSQVADAIQYGRGFQSVLGKERTGPYGFMEVVRAARNAGLGNYYWVAGSEPSAADKQWVTFWQKNNGTRTVNGTVCDINVMYNANGGKVGDDMSSADAYNGFAQASKDMANGNAEDLRKAWRAILWDAPLAEPDNLDNPSAEARLTLTDKRVKSLNLSGGPVDLDALADKLFDRIKTQMNK